MKVAFKSVLKLSKFIRKITISPIYLGLLIISIPLIGMAFQVYYDSTFSRSGALLVCVAIFTIYLNHFLSTEINNLGVSKKLIEAKGLTVEEILQNIDKNIQDQEKREQLANALFDFRKNIKENELPVLKDAQIKLVTLEFIAGVLGTLIWGFGDLLFGGKL